MEYAPVTRPARVGKCCLTSIGSMTLDAHEQHLRDAGDDGTFVLDDGRQALGREVDGEVGQMPGDLRGGGEQGVGLVEVAQDRLQGEDALVLGGELFGGAGEGGFGRLSSTAVARRRSR
jgi:hypothetical protein